VGNQVKIHEGLTPMQFHFAENFLNNGHNTKNAAIACGLKHSCNGTRMLNIPKVKAYIDSRLKQTNELYQLDFDYKIKKLKKVIDKAIPEELDKIGKEVSIGIQAVAEANKMQGDYAAEKRVNINANVELDPLIKATQDLLEDLIKKNERDY
jgi:phage terminase small subunit